MTAAAFDGVAADYDREFTHSLVGAAQRGAVWAVLDQVLAHQARPCAVLELNCGTGEDALHMASQGHRVVATDVSGGMLQVAQRKFEQAGVAGRVSTRRLDLQALAAGEVSVADLGGPFDLVFSNFGGLNCLAPASLTALAKQLAACLKPEGRVIMVVMPRLCLWESVWALLHLRPRLASRRWRGGPVLAHLGPGQPALPVWYYGVRDLEHAFGRCFRRERVRPIGLAVPPSSLEPLAQRAPGWLRLMDRLDRRWLTGAWGAWFSDHVLVQWQRRPG